MSVKYLVRIGHSLFFHFNILKYCERPFKSVDEMNKVLVANINKVVKRNDVLYHLGDFSFGDVSKAANIRGQIKCREIHLICGNHDPCSLKTGWVDSTYKMIFASVSTLRVLPIENNEIVMSHYQMAQWPKRHFGSYHLNGHSHGTNRATGQFSLDGGLSLDVGVDAWDYKPVSMEQVLSVMKWKEDESRRLGLYPFNGVINVRKTNSPANS